MRIRVTVATLDQAPQFTPGSYYRGNELRGEYSGRAHAREVTHPRRVLGFLVVHEGGGSVIFIQSVELDGKLRMKIFNSISMRGGRRNEE